MGKRESLGGSTARLHLFCDHSRLYLILHWQQRSKRLDLACEMQWKRNEKCEACMLGCCVNKHKWRTQEWMIHGK